MSSTHSVHRIKVPDGRHDDAARALKRLGNKRCHRVWTLCYDGCFELGCETRDEVGLGLARATLMVM